MFIWIYRDHSVKNANAKKNWKKAIYSIKDFFRNHHVQWDRLAEIKMLDQTGSPSG